MTMGQRFQMKDLPQVKVTFLYRVTRRVGAVLKSNAVLYVDEKNRYTVRDAEEFTTLFKPIDG